METVTRIGGDEFCVLFRNRRKILQGEFYWIIEKQKKSLHMLPGGTSFGSALIEQEAFPTQKRARTRICMRIKKHGNRQGDRGG